jgi:CRP-like cAMP-binding protein
MNATASNDPNDPPRGGPTIMVPALWTAGENSGRPLTAEEQALLAVISTVVRFRKGEQIYAEGERADAVFNIKTGVVKSYRTLLDGRVLETHQAARGESMGEVYLQMTRRDIAAYAGITPEAVTRSLRDLVGRGAITFRDRRHVQIINRMRLEAAIWPTRQAR